MDLSPRLLSPAQAEKCLNVTHSFLYARLLNTGALPSLKIGRLRRIPVSAIDDYIARIAAEQGIVAPLFDSTPMPRNESVAISSQRSRRKASRANAPKVDVP